MDRHILVAIDGSDISTRALEYAIEQYRDATITAIHVIEAANPFLSLGFSVEAYDEIPSQERDRVEALLEEATQTAADRGVEIQTTVETGKAVQEIVEYAEEADVDHIVIGSHGREKTSRILLGSVAELVARRSPVPITIIR